MTDHTHAPTPDKARFAIEVVRNPNIDLGLGQYTIRYGGAVIASFPCLTGGKQPNPFSYGGITPPVNWRLIEPILVRDHPHKDRGNQEMARMIPAHPEDAKSFSHTHGERTFGTHGPTDYPFMLHTNAKELGASTGCVVPYEGWAYARDLTNAAYYHAQAEGYALPLVVVDNQTNEYYTPAQAAAMKEKAPRR